MLLQHMPHIHEKIDFTVAIFVVHEGKVLRAADKILQIEFFALFLLP